MVGVGPGCLLEEFSAGGSESLAQRHTSVVSIDRPVQRLPRRVVSALIPKAISGLPKTKNRPNDLQ